MAGMFGGGEQVWRIARQGVQFFELARTRLAAADLTSAPLGFETIRDPQLRRHREMP